MSKYNYFLLLGLKSSLLRDNKYPKGFINYPDTFSNEDNIVYSVVLTKEKLGEDDDFSDGMILISSKKPMELKEGFYYAHAVETLLPISYFCIGQIYEGFSVLPLSNRVCKSLKKPWKYTEIVREYKEEILNFFGDLIDFEVSFCSCKCGTIDWIEYIVPYLKKYVIDPNFQRGCSYLFLSMWELGIDVCDWREENYDKDFYLFVSISRAEAAFLNAFKTVEAIVGEPSKNRTVKKLTQRLQEKGINSEISIGYRVKENIVDKIIKYHNLRDKIAAHGIGKIKRDLKLSEIIELQSLARYLLLKSAKEQNKKVIPREKRIIIDRHKGYIR